MTFVCEKIFSKIIGSGVYLPKRVVLNAELEEFFKYESDWIEKRTGICERRWCGESEDIFSMSVEAADSALKEARVKDFDTLIIARSRFTDPRSFVNAGAVHEGLKSKGYKLGSVDYVDGFYACSGSLAALNEANLRISNRQSKNSLIVSASLGSKFINQSHPESSCLWGDGAAALVVKASDKQGIINYRGKGLSEAWNAFPLENDEEGLPYVNLDGRKIFHTVVTQVPDFIRNFVGDTDYSLGDISCFLFHQANKRITDKLCEKLGIPPEKVYSNIERYGNTSSASIPIAYHEAKLNGKLQENALCLMVGFGAAFHMNCILYRM